MEIESVVPLIGAIGLVSLAISWHMRDKESIRIAQVGWDPSWMLFFYGAWGYQAKGDLILTVMSLSALPLTIGIARWENNISDQKARSALNWARGSMAYAGGPYC